MSGSDDRQWLYSVRGEQVGPVSVDHLRTMFSTGSLHPTHHVRHLGWDKWWTVRDAATTIGVDLEQAPFPGRPSTASTPRGVRPAVPGGVQPAVPSGPAGVAQASSGALPARRRSEGTPSQDPATAEPASVPISLRARSWAIDSGVLIVALFVFDAIFASAAVWSTLFFVALYVAYTFGLRRAGYETLGHSVNGLSLRDIDSGEPPDWFGLASRSAVVALLAVPLLLGLVASVLCSHAHAKSLAWHDLLSGTVVTTGSPADRRDERASQRRVGVVGEGWGHAG